MIESAVELRSVSNDKYEVHVTTSLDTIPVALFDDEEGHDNIQNVILDLSNTMLDTIDTHCNEDNDILDPLFEH